MSETSNNKFDNPTIRTAIETPVRGGTQAEVDAEASRIADAETAGRHKADKKGMSKGAKIALGIGVGTAVAVAGTVGGIAAFGPKANDDTTQGGNGNGEGNNGGNGGIEGNTITIEVSPESLAELSGPEQITEALSIPAVNAEGQPLTEDQYLTELEQNFEGLLNSGTTDAEYAPYEGTGNYEYEIAMVDKYDAAGLSALFVNPDDFRWVSENHKVNVLMSETARLLENGAFKQNVDITLEDTANKDAPASGAEMTIEITYTSNADEIGLTDFYDGTNQETEGLDRTARYTVHVVEDGNGHLKSEFELLEG